MSSSEPLKSLLYNKCTEYVAHRLRIVQDAIDAATESGNDETKSSAGDKHETGRAMMQLEQEKNSKQQQEVMEMQKQLHKINPSQHSSKISISAGKIQIDSTVYFAISPVSPIAAMLMGLSVGDKMEFNGMGYIVKEVI